MSNRNMAALVAALSGLGYLDFGPPPAPLSAHERARMQIRRGYPQTGTGKRQGERIQRQVDRAFGDPFAASKKCLARIHARMALSSWPDVKG